MQIKPISEREAMKRLGEAIGRDDLTESFMEELSSTGIVPAYMVFRPRDKATYPGKRFFLVAHGSEEISAFNGFETELRTLPFPLREGGIFRAAEWAQHGRGKLPTLHTMDYMVFAARADGQLDAISDEHFVRVYAPLEIKPAAKNVKDYLANKKCIPTIHGYCEAFAGFDIETIGEWRGMSPFTDEPDYFSPGRTSLNKVGTHDADKSKRSELITISALLRIIEMLSTEQIGRKYTQAEITQKILELFPVGISDSAIDKLFCNANKTRKALIADAPQKRDEWGELASLGDD